MNKLVSRELRKYLYGIAVAFVPFAVYMGWMDIEATPLIIALVVAIFNLSPKDVEEVSGPVVPEYEGETVQLEEEEDPYLGKHGITEGAQLPKEES